MTTTTHDSKRTGRGRVPRKPFIVLGLAALVGIGFAVGARALSGDRATPRTEGGAQPAPSVSAFVAGDFDQLPKPPTARPLGNRADDNGVYTQSFAVRNTTLDAVFAFYNRALPGAVVTRPVADVAADTQRGQWRLPSGQLLTVTASKVHASPGTTLPAAASQYDVQLDLMLTAH